MRTKTITQGFALLLGVIFVYDYFRKFIYYSFLKGDAFDLRSSLYQLEGETPIDPASLPSGIFSILSLLAFTTELFIMGVLFIIIRFNPSKNLCRVGFGFSIFLIVCFMITIVILRTGINGLLPYVDIDLLGKTYRWEYHLLVHLFLLNIAVTAFMYVTRFPIR